MLNFQCNFCETEIQADYAYIGEFVQCPICTTHLIVPDPILPYKSDFHGYTIEKMRASTLLWNTYEVSSIDGEGNSSLSLMRVPGAFFLKRVSNFDEFSNVVIKSGAMNVSGIPHLKDYSLVPGKIFFIFEHFKSHDLESFINKNGSLDPFTALEIIKNVAEALSRVWNSNMTIHQNLVPRNIRVNDQLESRIMNIGLSQYLLNDQVLLEQGFNIWDPRYISPEFAVNGKGDSPACDIYGLGGIFYFMITGKHPFLNIPVAEIPNAPLPEMSKEIPYEIVSLVQLMMAKQTAIRLKDWDEVIDRIHATFAKTQGIPKMKKFADKYAKHSSTPPIKAMGLSNISRGAGTEKFMLKKKAASKKSKMTDTVAKLATPEIKAAHLHGMKRKRQIQKSAEAKNYIGLMIVGIIALSVGLPILILVVSNQMSKNKTNRHINNTDNDTKVENSGNAGQIEIKKHKPEPKPVPEPNPDPGPLELVDKKPVLGTGVKEPPHQAEKPKPKDELVLELDSIKEFNTNNPEKKSETIDKYNSLYEKAFYANRMDIVEIIKINVASLENKPNTKIEDKPSTNIEIKPTSHTDEKVKIVMETLIKNVNPILENKEYDKAIKMIQEYQGALAEETLAERNKIIKKIKDKIQSNKLKDEKIEKSLSLLVEKLAPFLLEKKFMEADIQLQLAAKDKKSKLPKKVLQDWTKQISDYKKLSQKYKDSNNADEIIARENLLLDKSYIVKALLFYEKKQYGESVTEFEKVPHKGGNPFMEIMQKTLGKEISSNSVKDFKDILKEYDFSFDPEKQDDLLLQLTKRKISVKDAATLAKSLNVFANDKKNSVFVKKYLNIIEGLGIYCRSIAGVEIKVDK